MIKIRSAYHLSYPLMKIYISLWVIKNLPATSWRCVWRASHPLTDYMRKAGELHAAADILSPLSAVRRSRRIFQGCCLRRELSGTLTWRDKMGDATAGRLLTWQVFLLKYILKEWDPRFTTWRISLALNRVECARTPPTQTSATSNLFKKWSTLWMTKCVVAKSSQIPISDATSLKRREHTWG